MMISVMHKCLLVIVLSVFGNAACAGRVEVNAQAGSLHHNFRAATVLSTNGIADSSYFRMTWFCRMTRSVRNDAVLDGDHK